MTARQIKSAARRRAMKALAPTVHAPRAIVYVRMSMDRTGEGAGLKRQEEACRALCLARGWEVVEVVDDTMSATTIRLGERPGWQRVVKRIEAGEADLIVAWHLDRVTRSMKDLESLIELAIDKGIGLATATGDIDLTTDVGRMVARILAAVAAAETERKAERQILANDQRIAEGRPQWVRRPFGYEMDGSLRQEEAEALRKAYRDFLAGKGTTTIAKEWNAAGFKSSATPKEEARSWGPTSKGYNPSGWSMQAVVALLRSPRNIAKSTLYGEVMGEGNWDPIVDEKTWRAVQQKFADRGRPDANPGKTANLLSGIAVCGVCGGRLVANRRAHDGLRIYRCGGLGTSASRERGHVSIGFEFADGQIVRRMVDQMRKTGRVTFRPQAPGVDTEPLEQREREIQALMAELVEDRAAGYIDRTALRDGTAKLRAELAEIQAEITKAGAAGGPADEIDIEAAYDEFDRFDLGEQRDIIRGAFESIKVLPRGKGRGTWKPEHLETEFAPEWL
ncbi:recombinase family protein [Plantactinospora sp. WMMB782]|uniref:recombinase family protein n=1 Tax=Plantactinospora sp. WMMB782 TaxID=3404121 RepID=UPI003B942AAA